MTHTISLEDTPSLDIFRFAGAQAVKGFKEKPKKLDTPCEFFRKNKLRSFRYKVLEKGDVRLSVITPDGREHYAIHRNFILAYIRLVRSYDSLKNRLKS
ncbi:hypothetical protein [Chryseobacterium oncorhynchi]|uniref:Uncharacterized protein n=1 Tax=Chryseobacterium oncorhynchi TaxID=741074 RepID=A0A316X2S1_9FLAO|nr:hypothetical protein [Chryseobacterium oncorhynchi]PWN67599.1 hypothetical protein C1638_003135 [Chryseobacterium oncorhynchi]